MSAASEVKAMRSDLRRAIAWRPTRHRFVLCVPCSEAA